MKFIINKEISIKVILPMLIGITIYLFFRKNNIIFYDWINIENNYKFIINSDSNKLLQIISFSLPDAIWIFAYLNLILFIWDYQINYYSIIFIGISFSIFLMELMQYYNVISGTFDLIDIIAYAIGIFFSIYINKTKININLKIKNYEKLI